MLWCECGGNSSGVLIEDKLSRLHEGVWMQGVIYVSVVIVLYIIGFTIILLQGERSFNSSSAGGFLGLHFGCPDYYRRHKKKHYRHRDKESRPLRERTHSKEIELRRLQQEFPREKLQPIGEAEPDNFHGLIEDKSSLKKGNQPLIKVTVESSPKDSPLCPKSSTSNLLSFM